MRLTALMAAVLGLGVAVASAQNLDMARTPQAGASTPTRGMSMSKVESAYGAPLRRQAPVGDPPITRWEYPGFIVYFEYQYVIHSVIKHDRPASAS